MKNQKNHKVSLIQCLHIFDNVDIPWKMLTAALVFVVLSGLASLRTVTFAGDAVDASGEIPAEALVTYLVASVLSMVFAFASSYTSRLAQVRVEYLLRNKLWNKIIGTKQKVYDFDGGESLVSRVTSDCEYSSKFFETGFSVVSMLISAGMYIMQLYFVSTTMLKWTLIYIPLSMVLGGVYIFLRYKVAVKTQATLSDSTAYLAERTKNLTLIKTCNAQKKEEKIGHMYFEKQYDAQLKVGGVTMLYSAITAVMDVVMRIVPFMIGAVLVANGQMTVGILVTANTLFSNITTNFKNLITYAGNFKEANGALERVALFLKEDEEDLEAGVELDLAKADGIRVSDVRFGYDEKEILKGISCYIPKGKTTAVIGTNGSGKSTLFKLLTRLYEPNSGMIFLGDENANEYSLRSWRSRICMIAQGSPIMQGTVRENMCYGRKDEVSEEELMRVAKLSHVYDFVKDMAQGVDTPLSAGGGNLSGGQKQCIALARAMLSKADYILLDESTSNLDAHREKDVMDAVNELMKEKTTIIIAHSLAAIRHADRVLVVDSGVLKEEGTPEEIIGRTDSYMQRLLHRGEQVATAQEGFPV